MNKVTCPMCHGENGYIESVLYDGFGGGPFIPCGLCKGTGKCTINEKMEYIRSFKRNINEERNALFYY
jgi:hypothetical protein